MIIVSQNKRLSTKSLELSIENLENQNAKRIMVEGSCGKLYFLGKYATEERAKEVLQEMIQRYANWENMKAGQPSGICQPVYYMPED